jgi:4'-phosphopantetheinyl transferase EntD
MDVATAEAFGDQPDSIRALYPEERALIRSSVTKRQQEFATGRACARAALARLGKEAQPILVGRGREPLWPDGVVGSITHCVGYRAAAVADASVFVSVGIDAEPDEPLPRDVLEVISSPRERVQLKATPGWNVDRVLFSAKESTFKGWFPLTHTWLDFRDAHVRVEADGSFEVRISRAGPVRSLRGYWVARDSLILTAVVVRHDELIRRWRASQSTS